MYRIQHVVLCQGARNTHHSALKQKEKSEPTQTNDLALVLKWVGVYMQPLPAVSECPRLGLLALQPEGLAKASRGGGREGSTNRGM